MIVSELKKVLQELMDAGYGDFEAIVTVDRVTDALERKDIHLIQKEVVIE